MKINRVYIGNKQEAYISPLFEDGINLIYSNDNNKGKTILIQSIGYTLGNTPLFPTGFNYKDYYFILDIEHDNKIFTICRKNNNYFVTLDEGYLMLQGESDLKRWFNEYILDMPKIIKDQRIMITDFELLLQLFYLGQDKRDTSNISSKYFKKADFISMLCHLAGCSNVELTEEYLFLKEKVNNLKDQKRDLEKKTKLIKKYTKEAKTVSQYADQESFKNKMAEIQSLVKIQSELKNKKNRLYVRKSKNIRMINEINSIKISIPEGKLICANCGSLDIVYSVNKDISFEISNDEMKKQIITNLNKLNLTLNNQILEIDNELSTITSKLQNIIVDPEIDPIGLVLYKDELNDDLNYDSELLKISSEYEQTKKDYDSLASKIERNTDEEDKIIKKISNEVTRFYREFDKDEKVIIDDIFTKSSEVYSGSENTIFFISRLIAFEIILKHKFPLIIDGFREGEMSSPTEKKVLDEFKKLSKQIILTATLKNEEYHKYDDDSLITKFDFSEVESKHLLQERYANEFENKIKLFNIKL